MSFIFNSDSFRRWVCDLRTVLNGKTSININLKIDLCVVKFNFYIQFIWYFKSGIGYFDSGLCNLHWKRWFGADPK